MNLKKGIKELVADAKAEITTLGINEAMDRHGGDDVVFVDIRDVRELDNEGMVPDAVHAPRGMLEFWVDPDSPYHKDVFDQDDKTFIFYCRSSWRSALAVKALQDMGMNNVADMDGGFGAWMEAGGPTAERKSGKG
jgi:rhodanese-related sulfurtransferase